jgi:hypothetical protein
MGWQGTKGWLIAAMVEQVDFLREYLAFATRSNIVIRAVMCDVDRITSSG